METGKTSWALHLKWVVVFVVLNACVDKISFNVPPAQFQTIIEGMISDNPGPYTVTVSKSLNADADSAFHVPIEKVKIKLFDDEGNVEDLTESEPGVYKTGGTIQGQIGHAYHIRLETTDGKIFESKSDILTGAGEIGEIRYEYEARTIDKGYEIVDDNIFNVYLDGHAGSAEDSYVRWRSTGTYRITTNPELHMRQIFEFIIKDPYPCSGYFVAPALDGGILTYREPCTCCTCWLKHYETVPTLSDVQFFSDGQFKNVKVTEIPINSNTMSEKYVLEIEQMSLSRDAFEFFKLIRAQKQGAGSLFQPPSGEIRGNVSPANANDAVVGIFWATSITTKSLVFTKDLVPYAITKMDFDSHPCTYYPYATTTKPNNWD